MNKNKTTTHQISRMLKGSQRINLNAKRFIYFMAKKLDMQSDNPAVITIDFKQFEALTKVLEIPHFNTMREGESHFDKLFQNPITKYTLVNSTKLLYPQAFTPIENNYEYTIDILNTSLQALKKGILLKEQTTLE
jgi:hypothetical protein